MWVEVLVSYLFVIGCNWQEDLAAEAFSGLSKQGANTWGSVLGQYGGVFALWMPSR